MKYEDKSKKYSGIVGPFTVNITIEGNHQD